MYLNALTDVLCGSVSHIVFCCCFLNGEIPVHSTIAAYCLSFSSM